MVGQSCATTRLLFLLASTYFIKGLISPAIGQDLLVWRSGQFAVSAKLTNVNPTHIKLVKPDEKSVVVPISKLSDESFAQLYKNDKWIQQIAVPISGEEDNEARIRAYPIPGNKRISKCITFSRDTRILFFVVGEALVAINPEDGKLIHSEPLPKNFGTVTQLCVSDDGHFLAASGSLVLTWRINRSGTQLLSRVSAFAGVAQYKSVSQISFSHDSEFIIAVSGKRASIIETVSGDLLYETEEIGYSFSADFAKGNAEAAVCTGPKILKYDLKTGECVSRESLSAYGSPVYFDAYHEKTVLYAPSGYLFYGFDGNVNKIGSNDSTSSLNSAHLSPDNKFFFAVSDKSISHWDIGRNLKVAEYEPFVSNELYPGKISGSTISSCGRYIAAVVSEGKNILIFRPRTIKPFSFSEYEKDKLNKEK